MQKNVYKVITKVAKTRFIFRINVDEIFTSGATNFVPMFESTFLGNFESSICSKLKFYSKTKTKVIYCEINQHSRSFCCSFSLVYLYHYVLMIRSQKFELTNCEIFFSIQGSNFKTRKTRERQKIALA